MYKFRDENLCKIFHIFLLTNCMGSGIIKIRRARTVRAARKIKKEWRFLPTLLAYLEDLEPLKKLPTKLSKQTTPKACQNVNANAMLNNPSTQFAKSMNNQPSRQNTPNTIPITTNTANTLSIFFPPWFSLHYYYNIVFIKCQGEFFIPHLPFLLLALLMHKSLRFLMHYL